MKPNNGGVKQSSKETYKNGPVNRRIRAKTRLEQQLADGTKTVTLFGVTTLEPLTEKDIKRINTELQTLKTRI